MKNYLYKLGSLALSHFPNGFKRRLNESYGLNLSQRPVFEKYSSASSPICLVFNSGEKRPGCLTVGYEPRCDIRLEKSEYIKLNIPDESVDVIEVNLFLETIENDDYFWEFFREIGRLVKGEGKIKISFLDLKEVLNKKDVIGEFWNLKKRFLYSKNASMFNSAISYIKDCRRIVDLDTLNKIVNLLGFEIIKKPNSDKSIIKEVVIVKNLIKFNQWRLTNTLPREGEIIKDIPVYLFDCDSSLILGNFRNINLMKLQNRKFLSVIGSLFFLNLIPIIKPKEIVLFDINPLQVRYVKLIIEVILISQSFEEFLENFFSRKFNKNIEAFLSQPSNLYISRRIRNLVSDKSVYDATLGKVRDGKYLSLNGVVPVLKIEGNSMCQHITITNKEYFKPGPRINIINTSWGLSKNYKYIKFKLQKAKIIKVKLESKELMDQLDSDSLIYVSNIGEEDWLKDNFADNTLKELNKMASDGHLSNSFRKMWLESVAGFKKFLNESNKGNFWIIDSVGNIFSKNELLLERSDSHAWLWGKLRSKIIGTSIEVIHKQKGTWGFKEYLNTINYKKYLRCKEKFDTVILHILLGNGVSIDDFIKILLKASKTSKRVIIIEHDRDSQNFGGLADLSIIDIRSLMNIIRSVQLLKKSEISIEWSGASRRIDRKLHDNAQNCNRNVLVTLDL